MKASECVGELNKNEITNNNYTNKKTKPKITKTKDTIKNNAAEFAISSVMDKMKEDIEIQNNNDNFECSDYDYSDYEDDYMKNVDTKNEIPYSEDQIKKFINF